MLRKRSRQATHEAELLALSGKDLRAGQQLGSGEQTFAPGSGWEPGNKPSRRVATGRRGEDLRAGHRLSGGQRVHGWAATSHQVEKQDLHGFP
ncbi:hypothetical protein Droror1_Dr00006377 [Drosera rotundifolia]